MPPCDAAGGFERPDLPLLGSANEILVVTRENVPDGTLYFLQHRWRLCDYVRTPYGALNWAYSRKSR